MAENETKNIPNNTLQKKAPRRKVASTDAPVNPDASTTSASKETKPKRARALRPFPAGPFDEALVFTKQIYDLGSGTPVRRLTLFDHLQRTPDSSTSRMLVTNANKYSLLKGSYASE